MYINGYQTSSLKSTFIHILHFILGIYQYINMSQEISKKVIVVGCGIAGPVIAILLQKKGYTPIVVEKVKELGDVGASLFLQPNGYVLDESSISK